VFRGANSINLDSKGRIAIPAKYRNSIAESAESHMIVTCDPYENCLLIFTLKHWESTEADLQALSNSKPLFRRLKNNVSPRHGSRYGFKWTPFDP
jgi:MraZ protein